MKKTNIYTLFISLLLFFLPTHFFLTFFETSAYVNGLRIDYLIPKIYVTDILVVTILLLWRIEKFQKKQSIWATFKLWMKKIFPFKKQYLWQTNRNKLSILIGVLFLQQLLSAHPLSATIYLVRVIGIYFLGMFFMQNKKQLQNTVLEKSILFTLLFQSLVGIYHYLLEKSVFGYLFFGEPNLNNYIGVAKSTLFGIEKTLPYGTTAHPNILGGFIALYLLYLLTKIKIKFFRNPILYLAIVTLFLTQSTSAILAFLIGFGIYVLKEYFATAYTKIKQFFTLQGIAHVTLIVFLLSLIFVHTAALNYPQNTSFNRRNYLNAAAIQMTKENILVGVGLNHFTAEVEQYSSNPEIVRFVQPVHNIFLLFLSETGIFGVFFVALLLKYLKLKEKSDYSHLLSLLPIAVFDHYLLTTNTGLLLLCFAFVFLQTDNN